ncbi:MAG: 3-deoxy-D-manno-octulosonate 8-phosphate phosphatase [Bacteroides sp.]|nr:3-deoxy-D-manno-octulosonate 8-phosphate phosphatase [Bacteroides sp.]
MIKFLVLDVDGTLTDGKIYMGANGEVMKGFNIKDGYGINDILPQLGITPVIITGRKSIIVLNRAVELHISQIYQGVSNKLVKLEEVISGWNIEHSTNLTLQNVAYCGDDCNDLECMTAIKNAGGIVGCPSDAVQEVLDIADYISPHIGGSGAVRDFISHIKGKRL